MYLEGDQAEQGAAHSHADLLLHGRNPIRSPQVDETSQAHQKESEAEVKMWSNPERFHITCQGILPEVSPAEHGRFLMNDLVLAPSRDTRTMASFLLGAEHLEWIPSRDSKTAAVTRSPLLFNVTRDLNTAELIFEENRKYCNNRGCNMVTNETYYSPLHFKFLG